jgi:hypothetical protein
MGHKHFLCRCYSFTDLVIQEIMDKFVDDLYHLAAEGNLVMRMEMH